MRTIEYKGKKLAEVWVIHEVNDSCLDNIFIIKDNCEDARKYFEKRKAALIKYAERNDLYYIDDVICLKVFENGKLKYLLTKRQQRFEITDKEFCPFPSQSQ